MTLAVKPLAELTRRLVLAAQGIEKADTAIKRGRLVNVHTGEVQSPVDVVIKEGRVVFIGDASFAIGSQTQVIDAEGCYLIPGLLDGHMHVESSMVTVTELARAILPQGTTGIFMDPHEIANVLGLEGIRLMMEEARALPLRVYTTIPSCVPAAPGFEDTGAAIAPVDVAEAMTWPGVVGLGEMMNFPGVLAGDEAVHGEIRATLRADRVVTGHYGLPDSGPGLQGYIAAGGSSCHESTTAEEVLAKLRLGMYAMLREGSAWHDVKATIKSVTENRLDTRHLLLVTDDTHPDTISTVGHLNHVVRRAIQEGLDPIRAIQAVTLNTAEYFGVSRDVGSIAPGKVADILFLQDLAQMRPHRVMVNGRLVAENGEMLVDLPAPQYPEAARQSLHLRAPMRPEDFRIMIPSGTVGKPSGGQALVRVRTMEIRENNVLTRSVVEELPIIEDQVSASPEKGVAKVASIERHRGMGTMGSGFVKGFGFWTGAVASTVAHDSHNLLVVGMRDEDMALAANTLVQVGGGMVAVKDGKILALVPLPIAGLMSDQPAVVVAEQVRHLEGAWRELGCRLASPFMTMALLALPVLPELRLTNRGLVDSVNFKIVDLFVGQPDHSARGDGH
ncbi:MAG: adenine deaminase [Firmicutes bacterium]|nr:adenine deaminase [Bacillota bacterium]MCL5040560.1 adenine deaminase [Bacillota bacterium]